MITDEELLELGHELAMKRGWKLSTVGQVTIQSPKVFERLEQGRKVFMDTKLLLKRRLKEELKK